jgi:hypothetical protein
MIRSNPLAFTGAERRKMPGSVCCLASQFSICFRERNRAFEIAARIEGALAGHECSFSSFPAFLIRLISCCAENCANDGQRCSRNNSPENL